MTVGPISASWIALCDHTFTANGVRRSCRAAIVDERRPSDESLCHVTKHHHNDLITICPGPLDTAALGEMFGPHQHISTPGGSHHGYQYRSAQLGGHLRSQAADQ